MYYATKCCILAKKDRTKLLGLCDITVAKTIVSQKSFSNSIQNVGLLFIYGAFLLNIVGDRQDIDSTGTVITVSEQSMYKLLIISISNDDAKRPITTIVGLGTFVAGTENVSYTLEV